LNGSNIVQGFINDLKCLRENGKLLMCPLKIKTINIKHLYPCAPIKPNLSSEKSGLPPCNPHRFRYDFKQLIGVYPELESFVIQNKYNVELVDFANPEARRKF